MQQINILVSYYLPLWEVISIVQEHERVIFQGAQKWFYYFLKEVVGGKADELCILCYRIVIN